LKNISSSARPALPMGVAPEAMVIGSFTGCSGGDEEAGHATELMKSLSAAENSNRSRIFRVADVDEETAEPPSASKTIESRTYELVDRRAPERYRNY
jgi:hypothetical protein